MANFLLGLASGFAQAGNKSMEEDAKFNRELEQAARLQAMQDFSEKKKIYDKVQMLRPGTELASFVLKNTSGIDFESLDEESKKKLEQASVDQYDEIIKQFNPGEAPTYDNYKQFFKRDNGKVVNWLRDQIGITPKYAYSMMNAQKDMDAIIANRPDAEATILRSKADPVQVSAGATVIDKDTGKVIYNNPKTDKVDIVNVVPRDGGKPTAFYSTDPTLPALLQTGQYYVTGKQQYRRPSIDYEDLSPFARGRVQIFIDSYAGKTISSDGMTEEEKRSYERKVAMADRIKETFDDHLKNPDDMQTAAKIDALYTTIINNYIDDNTNTKETAKWNNAFERTIQGGDPGTESPKWWSLWMYNTYNDNWTVKEPNREFGRNKTSQERASAVPNTPQARRDAAMLIAKSLPNNARGDAIKQRLQDGTVEIEFLPNNEFVIYNTGTTIEVVRGTY